MTFGPCTPSEQMEALSFQRCRLGTGITAFTVIPFTIL
jgi:hypothetical protein